VEIVEEVPISNPKKKKLVIVIDKPAGSSGAFDT
jgi:hypothetical protein